MVSFAGSKPCTGVDLCGKNKLWSACDAGRCAGASAMRGLLKSWRHCPLQGRTPEWCLDRLRPISREPYPTLTQPSTEWRPALVPARAGGQKCLAQQSQHVLKVLLHPEPAVFTFDVVAGESANQDAVFRGGLLCLLPNHLCNQKTISLQACDCMYGHMADQGAVFRGELPAACFPACM